MSASLLPGVINLELETASISVLSSAEQAHTDIEGFVFTFLIGYDIDSGFKQSGYIVTDSVAVRLVSVQLVYLHKLIGSQHMLFVGVVVQVMLKEEDAGFGIALSHRSSFRSCRNVSYTCIISQIGGLRQVFGKCRYIGASLTGFQSHSAAHQEPPSRTLFQPLPVTAHWHCPVQCGSNSGRNIIRKDLQSSEVYGIIAIAPLSVDSYYFIIAN